jgi:hypothetical protein
MRRLAAFLAVAAALAIVGVAVGIALRDGEASETLVPQPQDPVAVTTRFEPDGHVFGEPITAVIEARLDSRVISVDRIGVDPDFTPYDKAGPRTVERVDHGGITTLTYRYPLRCLAEGCEPLETQGVVQLEQSRLTYRFAATRDDRVSGETIDWRPFLVSGRVGERAVLEIAWRAPESQLAAAEYRVPPRRTAVILLVLAALLAAAAGALAWRLWGAAPERETGLEEGTRTPLAVVLEAARAAAANGDVPRRRRALESVARELSRVGLTDLAADARRLAWSPRDATRDEVEELARRSETAAEATA